MEEEDFAVKRRVFQVADNELKRRKAGSTLELLKKQRNKEATRLLIQPPLVSTLVKGCARRAHPQPLSRPRQP